MTRNKNKKNKPTETFIQQPLSTSISNSRLEPYGGILNNLPLECLSAMLDFLRDQNLILVNSTWREAFDNIYRIKRLKLSGKNWRSIKSTMSRKIFNDLKELSLNHFGITQIQLLTSVGNFWKQLTVLNLGINNIENEGVATICNSMHNIERLDVSYNRISDDGVKHLTKLPKLQFLWLQNNSKITSKSRELLVNLPLIKLDVSNTGASIDSSNICQVIREKNNGLYLMFKVEDNTDAIKLAVELNERALFFTSDPYTISHDSILLGVFKSLMKQIDLLPLLASLFGRIVLEYGSDEIRNDKEIVMKAVRSEFDFKFASERLKNDIEVVIEAVKQDPHSINHVPKDLLQKHPYLINFALKKLVYYDDNEINISDSIWDMKEVVLEAMKEYSHFYRFVSNRLKGDKEIARFACLPYLMNFIPYTLMNDREIVLACVKTDNQALKLVHETLKQDREIVTEAIKHYSDAFYYVSKELQNDKEIALLAVNANGHNLRYVSNNLRDDHDVVLAAIKNDFSCIKYASKRLQQDNELTRLKPKSN